MKDNFQNLEKIVVNAGIGRLSSQPNFEEKLKGVIDEFSLVVGQKPAVRTARQSIAGFKLRAGTAVGLKATLRRKRMQSFFRKFVKVVLPRLRDFRGISQKSLDSKGNLTIGIKEHWTFPEVSPETSKVNFGLEVTMVPKVRNRERAVALYKELGIPFAKAARNK